MNLVSLARNHGRTTVFTIIASSFHYNWPKTADLDSDTLHGACIDKTFNPEAPWPSGRASDAGARGRGCDPHSGRRVVSLSKIHLPPKKYWYYPGSGGSTQT